MYYEKELSALKKAGRYRERKIFDTSLVDLASNDYLGLASIEELFDKATKRVKQAQFHAPKASLLVNGYHPIHQEFEQTLAKANGFEEGLVVGSGFLANLSLIEALVRKKDILFIDEEYHASGMVATKTVQGEVIVFNHNDVDDLDKKIQEAPKESRKIIAIEGVYSMGGDIAPKEIYNIANTYNALLIVDEAHSSGVIGEKLLGWFDHFDLKVLQNHIKMGTLGKAYASYGAYILASKHIIEYLTNRAKAIIYTTAPSLFDIALGLESFHYIQQNKKALKAQIEQRLQILEEILNIKSESLIIPIVFGDNQKVVQIQQKLIERGYLVGAIRQPTVHQAIIRLIAKIDVENESLKDVCHIINGCLSK